MTLAYRVKIAPDDNGTLLVACPALPEVGTFGDDAADALRAQATPSKRPRRTHRRRDLPQGNTHGPYLVRLPMQTAHKAELYRQIRRHGVTRAQLARRLKWNR